MKPRRLLASITLLGLLAGALAAAIPLSPSGVATVVGLALLAAGLVTLPARRGGFRGITRAAALLLALVPLGRLALAQGRTVRVTTLPADRARVAEALLDEQDVVVPAAHALALAGYLRGSEARGLPALLAERYAAMRAAEGVTASPLLGTFVLGQDEAAFDLVTVAPRAGVEPRVAVVFLHGFAGSFVLPCWQLAQAARAIDALTVCPATDFQGRWGHGRRGARVLRATLDWVRARGIERIYLAGLSNGAIGAGDLAPRFARELAGLVIISGGSRRSPPRGLPVLAVQGDRDTMTPPALARGYAARAGRRGTYVELPGNHFVFLGQHERARAAIARWLAERERARPGAGSDAR